MVAVDGSDYANKAFQKAVKEKGTEDRLFLLTCPAVKLYDFLELDDPFAGPFADDDPKRAQQQNDEEYNNSFEEGQKNLEQCVEHCTVNNIPHSAVIVPSNKVGDEICEQVKKYNIDTLYVGSRGHGTLGKLLLGSVSSYCSKNCTCKVVVVEPDDQV